MTRFILISGGKGGTGKTNTAINLAAALNYFGKDVTLIDANLTTPNVGVYLGAPIVPVNLHDVLNGKNTIHEAIYEHPTGTKIIPASLSTKDLYKTNSDNLKLHLPQLKGKTDFAILDGAAGLGRETYSALMAANEIFIVTNPELPAVTDALKTIKLAEKCKKKVPGIILTRHTGKKHEMSPKNVEALLEKPILGIIPEDQAIKEAQTQKDPVVCSHPDSSVAIAYKKLAASLIDQKYEPEDNTPKEKFFVKVLKKFGF